MKQFGKKLVAGILVLVICMVNFGASFFAYASDGEKKEKKGVISTVGGWFSDRGEDLLNTGEAVGGWIEERASDAQNVAILAVDATGKWFIECGEDICEVSAVVGNWASDRAENIQVFVTETGQLIVCAASNFDPSRVTTKEYYLDSYEKLVLGDYSDKKPTALSIGLSLASSLANWDLGMDIRDLAYDVQNYGGGEVKLSGFALDAVAVLPVIGVLKHLKYADTIAGGLKMATDVTDTATDLVKSIDMAADVADDIHDIAKAVDVADAVTDTAKAVNQVDNVADAVKAADQIDDVSDALKAVNQIDDVKDVAKVADIADDIADAGKDISNIPFDELPEEVQETFNLYADCGWDGEKALESMTDGTHAGGVFENRDLNLPVLDSSGKELSYFEFDAYPKGNDPLPSLVEGGRGPCRFIRDNLGTIYYTEDHYVTLQMITAAFTG